MEKSLNNFWAYIDNFYLRKPTAQQIERLAAMRSLIELEEEDSPSSSPHYKNRGQTHPVISDDYLKRLGSTETQNLLSHIHISQKLYLNGPKKHWKTIDRICRLKQELVPTKKKNYDTLLHNQKEGLSALIKDLKEDNPKTDDGLSKDIESLTKQLERCSLQNKQSLKSLQDKVREEIKRNKVIFIVNNTYGIAQSELIPNKKIRGRPKKNSIIAQPLNIVEQKTITVPKGLGYDITDPKYRMQMQLRFIQYAYTDVQRKILAESMCKLVGVTKSKNNVKFQVVFQQALQLQPVILNKQELLKLNSLKQLSLFKFYRVSGKCLLGNISQNIAGFTHLYKHQKQHNSLKNASIPEMIHKLKTQPPFNPAVKLFNKFQMCHNCQELYREDYLVSCHYKSAKPKYESQTPYAPKHKDLYIIKQGAYCCERKYCHHCLNNSYPNRKRNGLCPFCQQICYCPRCEKQSILTRFKGIYQTAGGDINKLQSSSIIAPLKKKFRQQELTRKRFQGGEAYEMNSIQALRQQMQECRQICQMVKRRQKQKLKLVEYRRQLFEKNLDFFKNSLFLKRDFQVENEKQLDPSKIHWQNRGKVKKVK